MNAALINSCNIGMLSYIIFGLIVFFCFLRHFLFQDISSDAGIGIFMIVNAGFWVLFLLSVVNLIHLIITSKTKTKNNFRLKLGLSCLSVTVVVVSFMYLGF